MKSSFFMLTFLFAMATIGQDITAMTYNIRYANVRDGENQWENRKQMLADQINFYQPHVLGVQEALKSQMDFLAEYLDGYSYVGIGRDDGKEAGEYSAIFFKGTLDTLQQGTFWLSETPQTPSKDWDAALPRICTYAQFAYQNNRFWVFNTHFDHKGSQARLESARLILRQINRLNESGDPVIIMGDLNAGPESDPVKAFTDYFQESVKSAEIFFGGSTTFSGFNVEPSGNQQIDYIFHSENITNKRTAILSPLIDQRYPSDHFAVISYFSLNN